MTTNDHRHDFQSAIVRDAHGQVIPGARRCRCGVEVTAGPIGLNVALVRAGQHFNDAFAAGLVELARRLERSRR